MSKSIKNLLNPLLGGALLAGALLMVAPVGMALADVTNGVNGRPDTPNPQPGVNAIQTAGDAALDSDPTIPGFLGGGPIHLNGTDAGQAYHALYGYSTTGATLASTPDAPVSASQGLTVGVVNSFTTPYKLQCNLVVQTKCGSFGLPVTTP